MEVEDNPRTIKKNDHILILITKHRRKHKRCSVKGKRKKLNIRLKNSFDVVHLRELPL